MPGLSLKGIALTTTLLTMLVLAVTYYAWGPRHEAFLVGSASTLYASGLTQRLFDGFNAGYGYNVEFKYIVRGSGDLLRLLADGSICVALTHSPPA
jgi:ABC-type tungstate transport system permease subunit